jgi:hypothetical protein
VSGLTTKPSGSKALPSTADGLGASPFRAPAAEVNFTVCTTWKLPIRPVAASTSRVKRCTRVSYGSVPPPGPRSDSPHHSLRIES